MDRLIPDPHQPHVHSDSDLDSEARASCCPLADSDSQYAESESVWEEDDDSDINLNVGEFSLYGSPPLFQFSTSSCSSTTLDSDMYWNGHSEVGSNIDHISKLELAFCSYFECCNLQLPDFHAFVDHCEEEHISRSRPLYGSTSVGSAKRPMKVVCPTTPSSLSTSRASSLPTTLSQEKQLAYTPFNPAISVDLDTVYPELANDAPAFFCYGYDYDYGYEYYAGVWGSSVSVSSGSASGSEGEEGEGKGGMRGV
ncbi:hypothetical protein BDQ17DRAFT_1413422 [Cyathus striatus]|nr:hypothetical protein BDQ17DRAFT_1413422 [Cyathus striatus]